MLSALYLLSAIGLAVLYWLDSARSREMATALAQEVCKRRGYQLLDDTVALARLGIARTAGGMRLRRMFRFDYSVEGVGRRSGVVIMRGSDVEHMVLGDDDDEDDQPPPPQQADDGDDKVVPFRRRH